MHAGLGRLHRVALVVHGRSGTGEVVDLADLDVERERDVVAQKLEAVRLQQLADVALAAGVFIVDAQHVVVGRDQPFAKVRTEKAGAAGDQDRVGK